MNLDNTPYYGSGGGRIAIVSESISDLSAMTIKANTHTQNRVGGGRAGTLFINNGGDKKVIIDQENMGYMSESYTVLPAEISEFATDPAFHGELAGVTLVLTNKAYVALSRDVRLKDISYLSGALVLNSWTLYLVADEPVGFPSGCGGGTIKPSGVCYTFDDGASITRDGRILWSDVDVTWRMVTFAKPDEGGSTAIDGVAVEGYYDNGCEPVLNAMPDMGYEFMYWDGTTDSGSYVTDSKMTLAPISGNRFLRAWFIDESADASTNSWLVASSSSDWNDPRNWSLMRVPFAGQVVIVPAGAQIMLTNATAHLFEFIFSGAELFFDGWETKLHAESISINQGVLTHAINSAEAPDENGVWIPNARVWLECDNLLLASGASINADGKGYQGGPMGSINNGKGPGGGAGGGIYFCGASHGGHGAAGPDYPTAKSAEPYDSAVTPYEPGSGGAKYSSYGGAGGGVVLIEASGAVTVNGVISVNATAGNAGGSGGSIYINCKQFSGNGASFSAKGSVASIEVAGGGGRIALNYDPLPQAAELSRLSFDVSPGLAGNADMGTLWFADTAILDSYGVKLAGQLFNIDAWSVDSLTVTNWNVRFREENFCLTVTNDLTISGTGLGLFWAGRIATK